MKTRNTFFLAGLFTLASALASGQDAYPVQVNVRIYQLSPEVAVNFEAFIREVEDSSDLPKPLTADQRFGVVVRSVHQWEQEGKAELFSQPVIAAPSGSWTTFNLVREITYPTEYDPATLPDKLPGNVLVGGVLAAEGAVKTNGSNVQIPPFPSAFEDRTLGLQLKIRPRLQAGGNVSVDFEATQSSLQGFINDGSPIAMEKPNALRKNAKPIALLENQILAPVILTHTEDFEISPSTAEYFLLQAKTAAPAKDSASTPPAFATFGREYAEPALPSLLFLVSGMKLNPGLKSLPSTDSGSAAAETRSWPLPKRARRSLLGAESDQPNTPAAAALKKRFDEIGIRTRELKLTPEGDLEVTAIPEMVERIGRLIPAYAANPQIFIATKFIETSKPIEIEKSILTEAEFQAFFRSLNQEKGVDLLSAPSIMVRPFQDGNIEVVRDFIYPISYTPPEIRSAEGENGYSFPATPSSPKEFKTRNTGVQLGIRTRLFEDKSIGLSFRPEVTELLGLLNFGQPIRLLDRGKLGKYRQIEISENAIEMPVFRSHSLESQVRIPDGGAIIVGGLMTNDVQTIQDKIPVLGDLPIIGKAARSTKQSKVPRYIYIALTAKAMEGATVAKSK